MTGKRQVQVRSESRNLAILFLVMVDRNRRIGQTTQKTNDTVPPRRSDVHPHVDGKGVHHVEGEVSHAIEDIAVRRETHGNGQNRDRG